MCLCSPSARFTPDGCDQRLLRHPLSPARVPTKHSCRGCHWTDVCRPAQLLVAGACHSARPRFISTSVTLWKNNMPRLTGLARCTRSLCSVMGLNPCCVSLPYRHPTLWKSFQNILIGWHQQFISLWPLLFLNHKWLWLFYHIVSPVRWAINKTLLWR